MATVMVTQRKRPLMQPDFAERAPAWRLLVATGLVVAAQFCFAQSPHFQTSVSVSETFTDNADATRNGRSDWITEVTPAVSISRSSGHVTGTLDASFRNLVYVRDSSLSESFVTLSGRGQVEVIDDSFFVDVNSSISRNNLSSFGGRPQWDSSNSGSQAETRYFSLAPRWAGHIGTSDVQFSMNYNAQVLSYGSDLNQQNQGTFRARLFDPHAGSLFGWSVDFTKIDSGYQNGSQQENNDTSLTGTLVYYATKQLSLKGIFGTETNNYTSDGKDETGPLTGYGVSWRPSPATSIDGLVEHHNYGDTYDAKFNYRRPLSSYTFGTSRHISTSFDTATSSQGSYYYNLVSSSLISQYPDPIQRDQATRSVLKTLGITNNSSFGNFATNALFWDQRMDAGFSLIGVRHTLAFSGYLSNRDRINGNGVTSSTDDFANNDHVKGRGWTVSLSHELTPDAHLTGALYWSNSTGTGGGPDQDTRDKGVTLGYSKKLSPKTTSSLNFRHNSSTDSDSANDYTENAVTAGLSHSF